MLEHASPKVLLGPSLLRLLSKCTELPWNRASQAKPKTWDYLFLSSSHSLQIESSCPAWKHVKSSRQIICKKQFSEPINPEPPICNHYATPLTCHRCYLERDGLQGMPHSTWAMEFDVSSTCHSIWFSKSLATKNESTLEMQQPVYESGSCCWVLGKRQTPLNFRKAANAAEFWESRRRRWILWFLKLSPNSLPYESGRRRWILKERHTLLKFSKAANADFDDFWIIQHQILEALYRGIFENRICQSTATPSFLCHSPCGSTRSFCPKMGYSKLCWLKFKLENQKTRSLHTAKQSTWLDRFLATLELRFALSQWAQPQIIQGAFTPNLLEFNSVIKNRWALQFNLKLKTDHPT